MDRSTAVDFVGGPADTQKTMLPARALPTTDCVVPIERAMRSDRITELARVLAELSAAGTFDDPALFAPPRSDHYARRLLWRDPGDRFVVIANTWAPGQGSPLHDHAGLWGAEIVVHGAMRETAYRAVERDGQGATRFAYNGATVFGERAVGVLVPPLEYHAYANVAASVSHTLHVYSGPLETCTAYTHATSDWWSGVSRTLEYDA